MTNKSNNSGKEIKFHLLKSILISGTIICLTGVSCGTLFEKDYSLKPEEYQKLGMPDAKKVWTSDDYAGSNITLSTLKLQGPLSLPRKDSKKSGVLFNRIVSEENLDFMYDTTAALIVRAYLLQLFPNIIGETEQMYTIEYKGKLYYDEEIFSIKEFELTIYERMLELAEIINNSNDESLSGFKDGINMVRYNYLKFIRLLPEEMSKPEFINTNAIESLSKKVSDSIIKNSEWINQSDKNDLLSVLNGVLQRTENNEIKNNFKAAIQILN